MRAKESQIKEMKKIIDSKDLTIEGLRKMKNEPVIAPRSSFAQSSQKMS
jgi:hypothetical protein